MTYEQIRDLLEKKAEEGKQAFDVVRLVAVWNDYCNENRYYGDVVHANTFQNFVELLPSSPVEAFIEGRRCHDAYFSSDEWVVLDDNNHITSYSDGMLVGHFISMSELAAWLTSKYEGDELKELLMDIIDDEEEVGKLFQEAE